MNVPATKAQLPIVELLARNQRAIESLLPKHLTVERLSRIAVNCVRKNPLLMQADAQSLYGAIMECAQYGLEPGIRAHLVPFKNNKKGVYEVNYIADYRGLIDLARRSGEIGPFYAFAVRANDEFSYALGLDMHLTHVPAEGDRGEITHFYAVAKAADGSWSQFDVMTKGDVEAIRQRSRAKDNGPWVTDYEAMGCKTVVRRLCKMLPASVELSAVVQADEAADRGEQDFSTWIEGEYAVEGEAPLRSQVKETSEGEEPEWSAAKLLDMVKNAADADALDEIRSLNAEHLSGSAKKSVTDAIKNKLAALTENVE